DHGFKLGLVSAFVRVVQASFFPECHCKNLSRVFYFKFAATKGRPRRRCKPEKNVGRSVFSQNFSFGHVSHHGSRPRIIVATRTQKIAAWATKRTFVRNRTAGEAL